MLDLSQRWTLWFESPNHLGCWAGAVLLIVLGLLIHRHPAGGGWRAFLYAGILWSMYLWAALLIAWSASRAAWIAVAVGCLVLCASIRTKRTWCLVLIGVLTITAGILSVDRVRDRAMTVTEMGQDGSSQSRPRTWGAACEMAAVHPWFGIGGGMFSNYYSNWYERRERDDRIRTANNDFLHLMAERGALMAVMLLMLYGLALSLAYDGVVRQRADLVGIALGTSVFFLCGWFNNVVTFPALLPWVGLVGSACLILVIRLNPLTVVAKRAVSALAIAGTCAVAVVLIGNSRLQSQPVLLESRHGIPCVVPTKTLPRGTLVLLSESDEAHRRIYREFFAALAQQGWQCLITRSLQDIPPLSEVFRHPSGPHGESRPLVVMCLGDQSTAMLAHLGSVGTSAIDGAILCDSTFPKKISAQEISCPILFIHGRLGSQSDMKNANAFAAILQQRWPESAALQVAWGQTWQRLVPRLTSQVGEWLDRTIPGSRHREPSP